MQPHIGITGGTGLVGNAVATLLAGAGYPVTIFSRSRKHTFPEGCRIAHWDPAKKEIDTVALNRLTDVIHLAGAGIADHRWTKTYKKILAESRVDLTHFLQAQLKQYAPGCKNFVAASAVGYYGPDRSGAALPFKEDAPAYNDFLGRLCQQWEIASLSRADEMRTVIFRFGVVLSPRGGAYPRLTQAARLGVLPVLGSGRQNMSWIHIADLATLLFQSVIHEKLCGVYNAVAAATPQKELMRHFAEAIPGKQVLTPVPAFLLRLGWGESSTELLKSCTVSNEKIKSEGATFQYPDIESAAQALAGTQRT